ncbi:hypothetical protein [Conexibacter sp. CPCC 206217]|uniref:hypothetical protein n=1 Tax=Conexibacter sp. CPCC 206217 TaxID=3064574 RepID=UPI0027264328|nr:hypothetical protein [Conexibacter sp. CPCC 206217]MDO8213052.1 hypothetical protein [Conexibacter sp. CPCC 206217]
MLDQLALADFLERGELDRHLRRMRPNYRARRDALVAAMERELPDWRPAGVAAGLSFVALMPEQLDERALLKRAEAVGMRLHGLSWYAATPSPPGLVLGFGNVAEPAIRRGVGRLAKLARGLEAAASQRDVAEPAAR